MKKREKYDHSILEKSIKREELEERLREIFFPKEKGEFFILFRFRPEISEAYEKTLREARKSPTYKEYGEGKWKTHEVRFEKSQVKELKNFFNSAENLEELEVLVQGKRIPYGRDLWLPLLWFYLYS